MIVAPIWFQKPQMWRFENQDALEGTVSVYVCVLFNVQREHVSDRVELFPIVSPSLPLHFLCSFYPELSFYTRSKTKLKGGQQGEKQKTEQGSMLTHNPFTAITQQMWKEDMGATWMICAEDCIIMLEVANFQPLGHCTMVCPWMVCRSAVGVIWVGTWASNWQCGVHSQ